MVIVGMMKKLVWDVTKAKTELLKWLNSLGQHIVPSSSDVTYNGYPVGLLSLLFYYCYHYYLIYLLYRCFDDKLKTCNTRITDR